MQRLSSSTDDQLARAGLFDWLAEAVLYNALEIPAGPPFHGPGFTLLRLLSTPNRLAPNTTRAQEPEKKEANLAFRAVFLSTLVEINVIPIFRIRSHYVFLLNVRQIL